MLFLLAQWCEVLINGHIGSYVYGNISDFYTFVVLYSSFYNLGIIKLNNVIYRFTFTADILDDKSFELLYCVYVIFFFQNMLLCIYAFLHFFCLLCEYDYILCFCIYIYHRYNYLFRLAKFRIP